MLEQEFAAGHQGPEQILDDGPAFGGGHDLKVNEDMNGGYTSTGYYTYPYGWQNSYLAGSYNSWTIADLHVYVVSGC